MNRIGVGLRATLAGLALAACVSAPSQVPASHTPAPSLVILPPSVPATQPVPTGPGLQSLLECDGPPSTVGGLAEDFGPTGGGRTAQAAFADWQDKHAFALPREGYVLGWSDEERSLYVYSVWGRVKVVVLISTRLGPVVGPRFTVDEIRACNRDEFGSGAVDGQRQWSNSETGAVLIEIPGHAHCAWQSIRFLDLTLNGEPRQYVRDPLSLLSTESLFGTLGRDVALPDDAVFSGYRSGVLELWLTPDDTAAYVVSPTGVDRWPRAREPLGCT